MNHHRGGQHQHRIAKGNVNYWPNRHEVGAPHSVSDGGHGEYVILITLI